MVGEWCKQIEQLLAESEQMRREADEIGPHHEVDHWKGRMVKFNSIADQIKGAKCKKVISILSAVKSKNILKVWKELDNRVTDAANESKVERLIVYAEYYRIMLSTCIRWKNFAK